MIGNFRFALPYSTGNNSLLCCVRIEHAKAIRSSNRDFKISRGEKKFYRGEKKFFLRVKKSLAAKKINASE